MKTNPGTIKPKSVFIAIVLAFTSLTTWAQDPILGAFARSYELENQLDFVRAISAIKNIYDEKSYEINIRLGWLCYEAGKDAESLGYYQKAIEIAPNAIEARIGLAYPASSLKRWDLVNSTYEKVLEIDPMNTTANYRLGYIAYDAKKYDKAYQHFEKVVNLWPYGYDALLMFAWSSYRLGKEQEAKSLFRKVLMTSPNNKSGMEGLSMIK